MANHYGTSLAASNPNIELAKHILSRLFRNFDGNIRICLWDGSEIQLGRDQPEFSLIFRSSKAFQDMVLSHHPLRVVESYFQGLIDIDGDLYSVLKLRHYLASLHLSPTEKTIFAAKALMIKPDNAEPSGGRRWAMNLRQRLGLEPSKELNRHAIAFHYDVSNDFYALWLDQQMVYSCAYYEDASQSLEQAQCNKLDHICRKLRLEARRTVARHRLWLGRADLLGCGTLRCERTWHHLEPAAVPPCPTYDQTPRTRT